MLRRDGYEKETNEQRNKINPFKLLKENFVLCYNFNSYICISKNGSLFLFSPLLLSLIFIPVCVVVLYQRLTTEFPTMFVFLNVYFTWLIFHRQNILSNRKRVKIESRAVIKSTMNSIIKLYFILKCLIGHCIHLESKIHRCHWIFIGCSNNSLWTMFCWPIIIS